MTTLLESPWPVIFVGILVEAALGIALLRTGRGVLLGSMAGVLVLVLAGVALEWAVVTEMERVEETLHSAAAALEANDEAVFQYLAPTESETRRLLRWAMGRVEFTGIRITHLQISINELTSPPTAQAHLTATVYFRDRLAEIPYERRPVDFTLQLEMRSDRWLVRGYQWHDDPRAR